MVLHQVSGGGSGASSGAEMCAAVACPLLTTAHQGSVAGNLVVGAAPLRALQPR